MPKGQIVKLTIACRKCSSILFERDFVLRSGLADFTSLDFCVFTFTLSDNPEFQSATMEQRLVALSHLFQK